MNKFKCLDEMNMLPNPEIKMEQQNSNRKRNSIVEEKEKKDKSIVARHETFSFRFGRKPSTQTL